MTYSRKSLEDIPSLEGLSIDWQYRPESACDQREYARIEMPTIRSLTNIADEIMVKIVTNRHACNGLLVNISEGGLALRLPVALTKGQMVKVGLVLGRVKIIARARVRHIECTQEKFVIGFNFLDLDSENAQYIRDLHVAKVLHHVN